MDSNRLKTMLRKNEVRIYEAKRLTVIEGITNPDWFILGEIKPVTEIVVTTLVKIKRIITLAIQRNRPKVIKFMGRRKSLTNGLTNRFIRLKMAPAQIRSTSRLGIDRPGKNEATL